MLLQCIGPGALGVWVVLLGGLGWDARGRGSHWCVSSCRTPLCSRCQVKAKIRVVHDFVLKEGEGFALSSLYVLSKALDGLRGL